MALGLPFTFLYTVISLADNFEWLLVNVSVSKTAESVFKQRSGWSEVTCAMKILGNVRITELLRKPSTHSKPSMVARGQLEKPWFSQSPILQHYWFTALFIPRKLTLCNGNKYGLFYAMHSSNQRTTHNRGGFRKLQSSIGWGKIDKMPTAVFAWKSACTLHEHERSPGRICWANPTLNFHQFTLIGGLLSVKNTQ